MCVCVCMFVSFFIAFFSILLRPFMHLYISLLFLFLLRNIYYNLFFYVYHFYFTSGIPLFPSLTLAHSRSLSLTLAHSHSPSLTLSIIWWYMYLKAQYISSIYNERTEYAYSNSDLWINSTYIFFIEYIKPFCIYTRNFNFGFRSSRIQSNQYKRTC